MEYTKIPNIFIRSEVTKKLVEGKFSSPELDYLQNTKWVWTEKVDGTNIRVFWDGYRVAFGGRTDKSSIPKTLAARLADLFSGESNEELFESMFGAKPFTLFGEGFGGRIQGDNGYGSEDFILFDVLSGDDLWLRREGVEGIAETLSIRAVPIVGEGTLNEAVEFIRQHPASVLRDGELEGIVCRPAIDLLGRMGERLIVKIKCRDFVKGENENG